MAIKEIMYFDKAERSNTDELVPFAKKRMEELGIRHVVIVHGSGYTLDKFLEETKDIKDKLNIITVANPSPHSQSRGAMPIVIRDTDNEEARKRKEEQLKQGITEVSATISDEKKADLEKKGVKVLYLIDDIYLGEVEWGGIPAGNRERLAAFMPEFLTDIGPLDTDAGVQLKTFTIISQGFRVALGCTILAVKNGLIPEGEPVLAMGGVSTALVLRAGPKIYTCLVKEIIGFERGSSNFERMGSVSRWHGAD
ncbi:hypothetical protein ACFLTB_04820 [Chloroflexota bacterium]